MRKQTSQQGGNPSHTNIKRAQPSTKETPAKRSHTAESAENSPDRKKTRVYRPVAKEPSALRFRLESRTSARHAAYCGLVAASIVLGIAIYQVATAIFGSGIDPSRNWAVFAAILGFIFLQSAVVIGLYYYSRLAAVGSLVIFASLALTVYLVDGLQSPRVSLAEIVLLLAFIQGIRGTVAYHRLTKDALYMIPR